MGIPTGKRQIIIRTIEQLRRSSAFRKKLKRWHWVRIREKTFRALKEIYANKPRPAIPIPPSIAVVEYEIKEKVLEIAHSFRKS